MIFLFIVIISIGLYAWGYKVPALIIFFFFLTSGFNLIPEEIMDVGFISKGGDFAFFILFGIVIIDTCCLKNYLRIDTLVKLLVVFGIFLIICILNSKLKERLGWPEIIRTCRYQFFWIAYLVFRNLEVKQLEKILWWLFNITVVLSILFLLQIVFNETILISEMESSAIILGMKFPRFYNQPNLIQFFTLMAIFHNPYKGALKIGTTGILICALLGAFHRSLVGGFFFALLLAYAIQLPRLRRIQFLSIFAVITVGIIAFAGISFTQSRTYADLKNISEGNYAEADEIDVDNLQKSTFTFRLAILYERNQYLLENSKSLLLGAGLIPEDSKKTNMYDFKVGLVDELTDRVVQTESGDISFATLVFRLGYLGTALYLMLLIYLTVFFYKKRNHKYGLISFLFWILSFFVSFFSSNLLLPATYLLPLMAYCIIQKTEDKNVYSDIKLNI